MTHTITGVAASTDTHCPYCALQCAMTLTRADGAADGAAPVVVSGRDFPTNRGGLCKKGWTSAELLRSPDRLTSPLVLSTRSIGTSRPSSRRSFGPMTRCVSLSVP